MAKVDEEIAMDVRAAAAVTAGQPLEITTVQLEGPRRCLP